MINGIYTAVLLIAFIGIAAWAYASSNRERFRAAAQLPLKDEEHGCCCGNGGGKTCKDKTS